MSTETTAGVELSERNFNRDGMVAFLDAYLLAPNDSDVEIRCASPEGEPDIVVLIVTLDHPTIERTTVVMTSAQARAMASIAEDTMRKFPNEPEAKGLPNLIMGLRHAANKMEAEYGR